MSIFHRYVENAKVDGIRPFLLAIIPLTIALTSCKTTETATPTVDTANTSQNAPVMKVEDVPFLDEKGRAGYRKFLSRTSDRAFALSPSGTWEWRSASVFQDLSDVKNQVLQKCAYISSTPCFLYAVNQSVVYDGPTPAEVEKIDVAGLGTASTLGISISVPDGWQRSCKKIVYAIPKVGSMVCALSKGNAIRTQYRVGRAEGNIEAWAQSTIDHFISLYASNKNKPLPYKLEDRTTETIPLSGVQALAAHEVYDINGYRRPVSQLVFEHNGFFHWFAVYMTRETADTIKSVEFPKIAASIQLK